MKIVYGVKAGARSVIYILLICNKDDDTSSAAAYSAVKAISLAHVIRREMINKRAATIYCERIYATPLRKTTSLVIMK